MSVSKPIEIVADRIERDVIGGAADIVREVIDALIEYSGDSSAKTMEVFSQELEGAFIAIMKVLPSFAPPINALHQIASIVDQDHLADITVPEAKEKIKQTGELIKARMTSAIERLSQYGANLIIDKAVVFMYSMSSTVWKILEVAKNEGKDFKVIVTESRPANEGMWTVDKMLEFGIPVEVSIDACIGDLIPQSDIVFVGADALSSSGTAFCKVGTYPSALVAKAHNVPFYVAADAMKFDPASLVGVPFRSEPVPRHEVVDKKHPQSVGVVGVMFDQTPPDLITGVVTEKGVIHPSACGLLMEKMSVSERINKLIPDWVQGNL